MLLSALEEPLFAMDGECRVSWLLRMLRLRKAEETALNKMFTASLLRLRNNCRLGNKKNSKAADRGSALISHLLHISQPLQS